jgi:flagellar capping protein FliD
VGADENRQMEQVVLVLEELTESFQHMQDKYEGEIDKLQNDIAGMRSQSSQNYKRLEQQYS